MLEILNESVEISIRSNFEELIENPDLIGKLVTELKGKLPELESYGEGYIFRDKEKELFFMLSRNGLSIIDEVYNREYLGIFQQCLDIISNHIKPDQEIEKLETTVGSLIIPGKEVDVFKCFDAVAESTFAGMDIKLRHLGFHLNAKDGDGKVRVGIQPVQHKRKEKMAFYCQSVNVLMGVPFNRHSSGITIIECAVQEMGRDILEKIISKCPG